MIKPIANAPRLKIGAVVTVSGLSVKTIRDYEDIGWLAPTVLLALSDDRCPKFSDQGDKSPNDFPQTKTYPLRKSRWNASQF